jgi:hypothetical protein
MKNLENLAILDMYLINQELSKTELEIVFNLLDEYVKLTNNYFDILSNKEEATTVYGGRNNYLAAAFNTKFRYYLGKGYFIENKDFIYNLTK